MVDSSLQIRPTKGTGAQKGSKQSNKSRHTYVTRGVCRRVQSFVLVMSMEGSHGGVVLRVTLLRGTDEVHAMWWWHVAHLGNNELYWGERDDRVKGNTMVRAHMRTFPLWGFRLRLWGVGPECELQFLDLNFVTNDVVTRRPFSDPICYNYFIF